MRFLATSKRFFLPKIKVIPAYLDKFHVFMRFLATSKRFFLPVMESPRSF
jgi:hypothetical protein